MTTLEKIKRIKQQIRENYESEKVCKTLYDVETIQIERGLLESTLDNLEQRHKDELEKKRKYTKGEPITSLDELIKCDVVWYVNKPMNKAFIYHQQLHSLLTQLKLERICYAIPKEK